MIIMITFMIATKHCLTHQIREEIKVCLWEKRHVRNWEFG